jgi:hypothetical protein
MASWQFRCKCCGQLRDAPMRPGGTVYLRCIVSRQWAWYEPAAFVVAAQGAPALRDGGDRAKLPRAAAGRRTRVAARATRGATGRKVARRARKRR